MPLELRQILLHDLPQPRGRETLVEHPGQADPEAHLYHELIDSVVFPGHKFIGHVRSLTRPGRASTICIGFLALLLAAAAQADEETDLFFKESEAWRESAITFATQNLAAIEVRQKAASAGRVSAKVKATEHGRVNNRFGVETLQYVFPNPKEKARIVAAWKAEKAKVAAQLVLLKSKKGWPTRPFIEGSQSGMLWSLHVLQVASPTTCRAKLLNEDNIWVDGISTAGIADDHSYNFKEPLIVCFSGTKTYTSVLGAKKTIRVLKPIEREKLVAKLQPDEELLPPILSDAYNRIEP